MSNRERVEAEAYERYPDLIPGDDLANWSWELRREAFAEGRTVTAEQVEAAAEAAFWDQQDMQKNTWHDLPEPWKEEYRSAARAALTAAGLLIEGDQ